MSTHLLSLIVFALVENPTVNEAKVKQLAQGDVVSVSTWSRDLKAISFSYRPKTDIDRDDEEAKVIEKVGKSLDGKVLKITGTVKSFQWKEGTGYFVVNVAGVGDSGRLEIRFNAPFAVEIDKEAAKTIKKGQSFELRAVVDFIPKANGTTHSKNAQHLANINSEGIAKLPWIGAFTTQVYEVQVSGKRTKGSWQTNP